MHKSLSLPESRLIGSAASSNAGSNPSRARSFQRLMGSPSGQLLLQSGHYTRQTVICEELHQPHERMTCGCIHSGHCADPTPAEGNGPAREIDGGDKPATPPPRLGERVCAVGLNPSRPCR